MNSTNLPPVTYEDFGAVGDGVHDDMEAIVAAHAAANAEGRCVKSLPEAIYYLGGQDLTAQIQTSTDWSSSRFTVDDRIAENRESALFEVCSRHEPYALDLDTLQRDQPRLDIRPETACFVQVENEEIPRFRRLGLNQNEGFHQRDCFILHPDGRVEGDIDWDYPSVTRARAVAIDAEPILLKGGIFSTIANTMHRERGYHYWQRNIRILRSNTVVEGLTHYVTQERSVGSPYGGFLAIDGCARITLRDCFVSGHRTYKGLGSAGKPVNLGTYDITARDAVDLKLIGCRMNHFRDHTLWGVIESNFCKNVLLEDCTLSRMDAHMGISGTLTLRNCSLGHAGFNAIGRGKLLIENTTSYGCNFINFRYDFGSTWDGDLQILNCTWIPHNGCPETGEVLFTCNHGTHDFGYPCSMPRSILVDGFHIDDSCHPENYEGPLLFRDSGEDVSEAFPFPYRLPDRVQLRKVTTASGKALRISGNPSFCEALPVEILED